MEWRRRRSDTGEIAGVLEALDDDDVRPALERELMSMGLRLSQFQDGTGNLEYHDLFIILTQAHESSPINRALYPEAYSYGDRWGLQEELLAGIMDQLNFARWEQHGKGKKPVPFPRPGKGTLTGTKRDHDGDSHNYSDYVDESTISEGSVRMVSGASYDPATDGNMKISGEAIPAVDLVTKFGLESFYAKSN